MGHLKDILIEREEYAQAARGRCEICTERLQQGEDEICSRCSRELEPGR